MRIPHSVKRLFALAGCLLIFLLSIWSVGNPVFCVEETGRVALETGIGRICDDAFQSRQAVDDARYLQADDPACVDISLEVNDLNCYLPLDKALDGLIQSPILIGFAPYQSVLSLNYPSERLQPPPSLLSFRIHQPLRTVVLLL